MRVRFGETGVDLLRFAMSWLFGCFCSRKERSHQRSKHGNLFASARQALSKVSSRRDKAQVLPDSGVENDEKGKSREVVIKTGDELRVHHDTETSTVGLAREEHNYETLTTPHASEEPPTEAAASLSVPFDSSIHGKDISDDYLSIDSVFPVSLLSDGNYRLEENTEGDFSICKPASRSVSKSDSEARTSQSSETRSSQLSFDEKPIMGLVATDWPEADSEVKSYKAWDGKGIPNSTAKYKEDQTISFQTISFEARLEQALATQHP